MSAAPPPGAFTTRARFPLSPGPAAAVLLLAVAVCFPPEVFPWSGAACSILLGLAALVVSLDRDAFPAPAPSLLLAIAAFGLAAIGLAACRARAVDAGADAMRLVLAGLVGWALGRRGGAFHRALLATMVLLGTAVACLAVLQALVLYPAQAGALRALEAASPVVVRLAQSRPAGTFSLPAALGGFLALALPATVACLRAPRRRGVRLMILAALLTQAAGFSLTRSFGALLALAGGVAAVLPALDRRRRRMVGAVAMAGAIVVGMLFLRTRGWEFEGREGTGPLRLRAGNWGAAARMIGDHPLFGVGPGAFGTFYPRTMRPGMNETGYAHNTYLQAAAEWGVWIVLPIGLVLAAFSRRIRRAGNDERPSIEDLAILTAGAAFLVHNLVDFTAYLPGVALPAALLLGVALGGPRRDAAFAASPADREGGFAANAARAAAAAIVLLISFQAASAARARESLAEAGRLAAAGETRRAADLARQAIAARRSDPAPHQFLAELILAGREDEGRAEGERAAATALHLDPESAILHYDRALYHAWAGEGAAAYREKVAARLLYPSKPLYRLGRDASAGGAP